MSKASDKLAIVLDACQGIMTRIYHLISFEKPIQLDKSLDKVCQHLIKKFPEYPENTEKVAGFDIFSKKASELTPVLRDFYLTFLDALEWREAAWALLEELAQHTLELHFDGNHDLMCKYMDLLVGYVQLLLLLQKIPERKLLLTIYARAVHCTEANSEPNFSRIATFVHEFTENPLRKLQDDCHSISLKVGDALLALQMMFYKWTNPKSLRDTNILNVLEQLDQPAKLVGLEGCIEISWLERMKVWILYGFLVCPSQLERPGSLDLVKTALSDTWLVPIFRDHYMEIHSPYRDLYKWYRINKFKFDDDVNKQPIKDGVNNAVGDSARVHGQIRTHLRWYISQMINVFREQPGVIAPKVHVVLAAVSLAKSEVMWYFYHQHLLASPGFEVPKTKAQHNPAEFVDPLISELIGGIDVLVNMLSTPETVSGVSDFYMQQLHEQDVSTMQTVLGQVAKEGKVNASLQKSFSELSDFLNALSFATLKENPEALENFRTTYHRLQAGLSAAQGGLNAKTLRDIGTKLNPILYRTRCVDQLAPMIRSKSSLSSLWFFNNQGPHNKESHFDKAFEACLSGVKGQPIYAFAFVRLLHSALENVHRFYPEEQKAIGMHAVRVCRNFLRQIAATIDSNTMFILQKEALLTSLHIPFAVVQRTQQQAAAAQSGTNAVVPLPGYESEHMRRQGLADIRNARKIVAELSSAVRDCEVVTVFDHEFCPREFLAERLLLSIRASLRKNLQTADRWIVQPSLYLDKITLLVQAYNHLSTYINLDIHEIVKQALLLEFSDPSGLGAGDSLEETKDGSVIVASSAAAPTADSSSSLVPPAAPAIRASVSSSSGSSAPVIVSTIPGDNCMQLICQWYVTSIFSTYLASKGVCYSEYAQSFISKEYLNSKSGQVERWLPIERHTDPSELRALCTFVGPSGIRCLEREVLNAIAYHCKSVQQNLGKNRAILEALSSRYTEDTYYKEASTRLAQSGELSKMSFLLNVIGCLMKFRQSLQVAMAEVAQRSVAPVFELLRQSSQRITPLPSVDPAFASLNSIQQLAIDLGADTVAQPASSGFTVDEAVASVVDPRLRSALSKVMSGKEGEVWNLLPELMGAMFAADDFKLQNPRYMVLEDSYSNNVHMMATAAVSLIATTAQCQLPNADRATLRKTIQASLQRYVRFSAFGLLTIKPLTSSQQQDASNVSFQSLCLPIIDFIVHATKNIVTHSYLEEFFPHSLVRHNYINLCSTLVKTSVSEQAQQ